MGLQTTVAAEIEESVADAGAVDELLFGEDFELFRGDEVGTLD